MSRTTIATDDRADALPLADLLNALAALNVEFRRGNGEALALKSGSVLTGELREAVTQHKPALLEIADIRAELSRLHEYIIRLRCEDPPNGTREKAFAYQAAQIEKLAARSVEIGGTEDGWPDSDAFADNDQITGLRYALAEVEAGPYPVPLPPGCVLLPQANFDPFAHGWRYDGTVIMRVQGL